jgi:4a-hydroxytetrahydrobiopterin dehydratase
MQQLTQMVCTACHKGAPTVTEAEMATFLPQVPDWQVIEVDGIKRLQRAYTFQNFVDALAFTDKVGALAEAAGHHPTLLTEWGKTTVAWWTHKIRGLHQNDFIMAAQSDQAYQP